MISKILAYFTRYDSCLLSRINERCIFKYNSCINLMCLPLSDDVLGYVFKSKFFWHAGTSNLNKGLYGFIFVFGLVCT